MAEKGLCRARAGNVAPFPFRVPIRNTTRGDHKTDLGGRYDLVICGASFAGLAVAEQVAGRDANVLMIDRYEVGERQTSACAIPTDWLEALDLLDSEAQRFDDLVVHTPHRSIRIPLPWEFSTFDYPTLCDLMWERSGVRFETAKVNGRKEGERDGLITIDTDRGEMSAPLVVDALGWRRILDPGSSFAPPDAPLSRGLEVHPAGGSPDLEVWIDRSYVPAGYGWSFPAGNEVRVGVGSFDPGFHVRKPTEVLAGDLGVPADAWQGNWIPHRLREATSEGVFFAGDSAGHCYPLTAEGIRPALYFGLALGSLLDDVLAGRSTREGALAAYGRFSRSHMLRYDGLLATQRMLPRIPPRLLPAALAPLTSERLAARAFARYLDLAPPGFVRAIGTAKEGRSVLARAA
jgi:flavin-dependent dehydrogenase